MSGNTAVVGMSISRAVYIFVRSGTSWSQQAKLTSLTYGDSFGAAVAIDGDSVIVGAPYDEGNRATHGCVYVYVRSGTSWIEEASCYTEAYGLYSNSGGRIGGAVAIRGNIAVVGNQGGQSALVLFRYGGTGQWNQRADYKLIGGGGFGHSVAISGTCDTHCSQGECTVAIGAPYVGDRNSGSAYVLKCGQTRGDVTSGNGVTITEIDTVWIQDAQVVVDGHGAAYPGGSEMLGNSVAIGPDTLAAGAVGEGSVYTFAH